jgi:hypothetical protein
MGLLYLAAMWLTSQILKDYSWKTRGRNKLPLPLLVVKVLAVSYYMTGLWLAIVVKKYSLKGTLATPAGTLVPACGTNLNGSSKNETTSVLLKRILFF